MVRGITIALLLLISATVAHTANYKPLRGDVEVDWNNPITRGLVAIVPFYEGSGMPTELLSQDSASKSAGTWSALWEWQIAVPHDGAAYGFHYAGPWAFPYWKQTAGMLFGTSDFTVGMISSFIPGVGTTVSLSNSSGSYQWRLQANYTGSASSSGAFAFITYSAGAFTNTGTTSLFDVSERCFFVGVRQGGTLKLYKNGAEVASATGTIRDVTGNKTEGFGMGWTSGSNWSGNSYTNIGQCSLIFLSARALQPAEIAKLYEDPWQLFRNTPSGFRVAVLSAATSDPTPYYYQMGDENETLLDFAVAGNPADLPEWLRSGKERGISTDQRILLRQHGQQP